MGSVVAPCTNGKGLGPADSLNAKDSKQRGRDAPDRVGDDINVDGFLLSHNGGAADYAHFSADLFGIATWLTSCAKQLGA